VTICPCSRASCAYGGMDPAEVLADFGVLDAERRSDITTLETAKQRRNELSPRSGS